MKGNCLFAIVLLFFGGILAAPSYADTVTVPLPERNAGPSSVPEMPKDILLPLLDLSLSSWAPSQLHPATSVPTVSAFSSSFPAISVSYLGPFAQPQAGDFYFRAGLDYRSETRSSEGLPTETLHLVTFRLGPEWKPAVPRARGFTPFLDFNLLPTWASSSVSSSTYDNGISTVTVPVEFDLGTEMMLSTSPAALRLTLAGQLVIGRILGSSLVTAGIMGGIRVPL